MEALAMGFDVEIDVWYTDSKLWLGHDKPQYEVTLQWINERKEKLWMHCKNIQAIEFFNWFRHDNKLNCFWHETDTVTLTSRGYIWAYPGTQPIENSITVLPEIHKEDIRQSLGICSDFIKVYYDKYNPV